jgi:hypothetical protein
MSRTYTKIDASVAPTLPPGYAFPMGGPPEGPSRKGGMPTLLFGLTLAVSLPPEALLAPTNAPLPTIYPSPVRIVVAADLSTSVGRPVTELHRVRVGLGGLDRRLQGLSIAVGIFQVTDETRALVSVGVAFPDETTGGRPGATVEQFWALTHEILPRHAWVCEQRTALGQDALLAFPGNATAQAIWLTSGCLATVGIASLQHGDSWIREAACAIAQVVDRRLRYMQGTA